MVVNKSSEIVTLRSQSFKNVQYLYFAQEQKKKKKNTLT